MTQIKEIEDLLYKIFESNQLILCVMSSPHLSVSSSKVSIRSIVMKEKKFFQLSETREQKIFHRNLEAKECLEWIFKQIGTYKQTYFYTQEADYHVLANKHKHLTLLKKKPTKSQTLPLHNRKKEYVLEEGQPIPFLVHLNIMNKEGKVYPAKQDKFRQINRFLELVEETLSSIPKQKTFTIVDFGCGKAYLTFALYHFLKFDRGYHVHLIG